MYLQNVQNTYTRVKGCNVSSCPRLHTSSKFSVAAEISLTWTDYRKHYPNSQYIPDFRLSQLYRLALACCSSIAIHWVALQIGLLVYTNEVVKVVCVE